MLARSIYPRVITVQGAGCDAINGDYRRSRLQEGVIPSYYLETILNDEQTRITLYHYKMSEGLDQWYISVVPLGLQPGSIQDLNFYYADADEFSTLPPHDEWKVFMGHAPAPTLLYNAETECCRQHFEPGLTLTCPSENPTDVLAQVANVWQRQIKNLESELLATQKLNDFTNQRLEETISEKEQFRDDAVRHKEELARTMQRLNETVLEKEKFAADALQLKAELARREKEGIFSVLPASTSKDALRKLCGTNIDALESSLEKAVSSVRQFQKELVAKQKEESCCCICYDAAKSVVLIPCNHLCVCEKCCRNTSSTSSSLKINTCPICREDVKDILVVFSS
mmetsp:Transcript_13602/g.17925  ORF Transcript_13602/g.17925 Transcript_13602/m.17925 type:complete len:341 (+) Transcript_13602:124-1146(+)